ncbi:VanZ family protein [Pseudomonas sp. NPDC078700]|uniref:VanZ family protein n=1 Tax=Pseudomonas sp. NPDC078700 TaxID=3364424 RepID=UPI0037CB6EDE
MIRTLSILCFLTILAITVFAGMRSEAIPEVFEHQDWLHHAVAFIALVCSARWAFPNTHAFWTLLYCLLLGLLIELFQGLLPHRTSSVADMIANTTGVIIGIAIATLVKHKLALRHAAKGW